MENQKGSDPETVHLLRGPSSGAADGDKHSRSPKDIHRGRSNFDHLFGDSHPAFDDAAQGSTARFMPPPPGLAVHIPRVDIGALNSTIERQGVMIDRLTDMMQLLLAERASPQQAVAAQQLPTLPPVAAAAAATPVAAEVAPAGSSMNQTLEEAPLTMKEVLNSSELKHISSSVEAKIKKIAAETRIQLKNYSKSRAAGAKLKERVEDLSQGRFPVGVKPLKLPNESVHYHEPLEEELTIELKFPRGETIGDVKKKLYAVFLEKSFASDLEVESRRQSMFRTTTSLSHFITKCEAAASAELQDIKSLLEGVDAPVTPFEEGRQLVAKVAGGSYRKLLAESVGQAQKERDKTAKAKAKDQKLLDEAAKLSGVEVIQKVVEGIMKPRPLPKGSVNYTKMVDIHVSAPELVENDVPARPKNGATPGAARGNKGQGKGGGKNGGTKQNPSVGKGKGKANAKNTSTVKGKGKGNGSGKNHQKGGGAGASKGSNGGGKPKKKDTKGAGKKGQKGKQ